MSHKGYYESPILQKWKSIRVVYVIVELGVFKFTPIKNKNRIKTIFFRFILNNFFLKLIDLVGFVVCVFKNKSNRYIYISIYN